MILNVLVLIREWDAHMAGRGLSDRWTRRPYRYAALRFLAEACPEDLTRVRQEDVRAWLATLGKHAATRRQHLYGLRSFFSWAAEAGFVPIDPTLGITPDPEWLWAVGFEDGSHVAEPVAPSAQPIVPGDRRRAVELL